MLSAIINAYLKLDPESQQRLQPLKGKVITIEFLPFHFIFQCAFTEHGVEIHKDASLPTETTIRGTPLQMLGVAVAKDHRHRFFAEDVIIEGNAEFGQQVIALFDEMKIDWQQPLSQFIGDVPTYHISRFIERASQWLQHTENTMAQNVNEYLHEEAEWFPSREALNDFFTDIDTLRMDTDRLRSE